ncbi:hypothetical protein [Prosthecomicrobium sp. N25]|uniref:hypothetical protein n=1 Tax=Prosthecomicrobium sp. N25 TaxID=3129254 RepID=UPI003076F995
MLKRSFTAVVERNVTVEGRLETEPYETGWAGEARWFVHVLAADADTVLRIASEISPDGLTWCAHEADPVSRRGPGLVSLPLTMVGPWQRLVLTTEPAAPIKVIVYLTLRE